MDLLVAHHETHVQKEVSKTLMTLLKKVRMAPLTSQVVEADIQGNSDVIAPFSLFLFSQSVNLPEGIVIQDECNEEGKYLIEIEKIYISVLLPRSSRKYRILLHDGGKSFHQLGSCRCAR
jgi:hypothetical protein